MEQIMHLMHVQQYKYICKKNRKIEREKENIEFLCGQYDHVGYIYKFILSRYSLPWIKAVDCTTIGSCNVIIKTKVPIYPDK